MMMKTGEAFELGGVRVPWVAGLGMTQSFRVIGGFSTRRLMSGRALKQSHWEKLEVVIAATGLSPAGLQGLDFSQPLLLKCGEPRAIRSQSTSIALPVGRRSGPGYEPFARAYFADRREVFAAVTVASHVATITPVAGAIGYAVWYYPQLTVIATAPEENTDHQSGTVSWTLTAEEQ